MGDIFFYAPNFGKAEGAYCFGLVRSSILPSVCASLQNLLRYSFEISHMDSSSKNNQHFFFKSGFYKTLFLCVNIFQPVGDDTEDCRIELEPRSGVLEPREKKSITVHFKANRTVSICVTERTVELSWNPEVECWNQGRRNQLLYTL